MEVYIKNYHLILYLTNNSLVKQVKIDNYYDDHHYKIAFFIYFLILHFSNKLAAMVFMENIKQHDLVHL